MCTNSTVVYYRKRALIVTLVKNFGWRLARFEKFSADFGVDDTFLESAICREVGDIAKNSPAWPVLASTARKLYNLPQKLMTMTRVTVFHSKILTKMVADNYLLEKILTDFAMESAFGESIICVPVE